MQQAIGDYVGEHDWLSFVASGYQQNNVRTVYSAKMWYKPEEEEIWFGALVMAFCTTKFAYGRVLLEINGDDQSMISSVYLSQRQQAQFTASTRIIFNGC